MKRIGLIGGTSWPSTIEYYRLLNQLTTEKLGGYHSANLMLYSIDYHEIKSNYTGGWDKIPGLLKKEIKTILTSPCDCLILCNNTLHKAFDIIQPELNLQIPFFHAVDLTGQFAVKKRLKKLLLLGTKFTMEDGFFSRKLEALGLEVTIPNEEERNHIQSIQTMLAQNSIKPEHIEYFRTFLSNYSHLDAVILACTELPLVVTSENSALPIINPIELQCNTAMDFALQ